MKNLKQKPIFFCGLGEQPSAYKSLSKYLDIIPINWNKIKLPRKRFDIVVGFSIGATLACDYALKQKVKKLILCSMTTGVETLKKVKAEEIIFLIGEKEKWVIEDTQRLLKTIKDRAKIIVIPKADHKINKNYKKAIFDILDSAKTK